MYDAEVLMIYNIIEAITVIVRKRLCRNEERLEIVTRSYQNINQHKVSRYEYDSTFVTLLNPYVGKLL